MVKWINKRMSFRGASPQLQHSIIIDTLWSKFISYCFINCHIMSHLSQLKLWNSYSFWIFYLVQYESWNMKIPGDTCSVCWCFCASCELVSFNLFYLVALTLITKILGYTKKYICWSDKKKSMILAHSHWWLLLYCCCHYF